MGGIIKVTEAIERQLRKNSAVPESQLVVVCGKNTKAKQRLESRKWKGGVSVHVNGFVSNMPDLMAASDCIVTKAGPGTIAEAMCRGLPTLLSSYLPGQEAGNVPFVEENKFGAYAKQPKKIAATVTEWMADPEKLATLSSHALAASRPSATYDIARDIAELAFAPATACEADGAQPASGDPPLQVA